MRNRSVALFLLFGCSLFVLRSVASADTIELLDGSKKTNVQIIEENVQKVLYKTPRVPNQSVASDQVRDVKFFVSANDFKTAQEAYKNSDWENAANLYKNYADGLGPDKAALKAHCLYRVAECDMKAGAWKEAIDAITVFAKDYPTHRVYPELIRDRAICYFNLGDRAKAEREFSSLKDEITRKGISEGWKDEVDYWLIFLDEQKKPQDALAAYSDLYKRTAEKYPEVANKARLRMGRLLIDQKQFDNAMKYLNEIIDHRLSADRTVAAGAYVARGLCTLKRKKPEEQDYKDALFDFLRVVVHYKDVGEHQAEAMYWAGKCLQQFTAKDGGKRWKALFARLVNEWPKTSFAKEAGRELGI